MARRSQLIMGQYDNHSTTRKEWYNVLKARGGLLNSKKQTKGEHDWGIWNKEESSDVKSEAWAKVAL